MLADDLGYGDLGSYGQQLIVTPRLDSLATLGMRFTQHYAGSTVCAPSRSVLMTGLHTGHTYIRGNEATGGHLPDSIVTLAEILRNAGYHTHMVGKWGLGTEQTSGEPLRQGFTSYYGYLDQVYAHNYYPEFLLRNGKREPLDNTVTYVDSSHWSKGRGSVSTEQNTYSHDLFEREALAYLETRVNEPDDPFFLYLPFTLPHDNGEAQPENQFEVPDQGRYAERNWTKAQKDYAAMVTRLDLTVGRLIDKLTAEGLADNTIFVFTSDNGPIARDDMALFNSNGPLRGYKRDMYEGGIRVPLIVRWPGRVAPGSISDHPSAFWDWLPTLAEAAGINNTPQHDGITLIPTLTGRGDQPVHDHFYWNFDRQGGKYALRRGNWKLVKYDAFAQPKEGWQLYNLADDPGEKNDLAASNSDKVAELLSLVSASHTPSLLFPFPGLD